MTAEFRESLLRDMVRIRRVEETLAELYPSGEMRTPTHFSIGQEAVAVGVCGALRRDDVVYSGHRCHAHSPGHRPLVEDARGAETSEGLRGGAEDPLEVVDPDAQRLLSEGVCTQQRIAYANNARREHEGR